MGVRVNFRQTLVDLQQVAKRTTRASRRQIAIEARRLEDLSRKYTPVDSGDLEGSHRTDRTLGARGRVGYTVGFGDNVNHAITVHENLSGQAFGMGEKSRAKAAALGLSPGIDVGPFFLTRAFDELETSMVRNMEEAVRKA